MACIGTNDFDRVRIADVNAQTRVAIDESTNTKPRADRACAFDCVARHEGLYRVSAARSQILRADVRD